MPHPEYDYRVIYDHADGYPPSVQYIPERFRPAFRRTGWRIERRPVAPWETDPDDE